MRAFTSAFGAFLAFLACFAASTACGEKPAALDDAETAAYLKTLSLDGLTADAFAGVAVVRDLAYSPGGGEPLRMNLFLPAAHEAPVPCIVVITGGGFRARDRARFSPMAAYLAANGFAAASIDYRAAPDDTFLTTVGDTKAAVRFLRASAERYAIDPDRFGAFGQSAGGHLAAMLAVTGGVESLEGDGGNRDVSSRIQAAVTFAGVFDFISRLRDGGQQTNALETKRRTNGAWVGEPFSETSETWRKASPITYVTDDDPPILFVHCRADNTVPFAQSVQMVEAMQAHGDGSRLVLYDGGGHGITKAAGINGQAWRETLDFFGKTLANSSPSK